MKLSAVGVAAVGVTLAGLAWGAAESTSRAMSFDECQSLQANVIAQLNVPPEDIIHVVNTAILTITRVITADGSVLISCSDPDQKMVITRSTKGR